jgi:hypothetical protein
MRLVSKFDKHKWPRLYEQIFRFDKWSVRLGQAAKRMGSGVK